MHTTTNAPAAGATVTSRTVNTRHTAIGETIDAYIAAGVTDPNMARFAWWKRRVGQLAFAELTEEVLDDAFAALASDDAVFFAGKTKEGRLIFRSRGKRSGATINRYRAALMSVIKFARRKRLVPRGW